MSDSKDKSPVGTAPMGKVCLVTGANRGLGFAVARALAKENSKNTVIISGRDSDKIKEATWVLLKEGLTNVYFSTMDVSDDKSVQEAAKTILKTFKRVDVLINNAGIALEQEASTPAHKVDPQFVLQTMQVNLLGPLRTVAAFLPSMMVNNYGRIVNVSSAMGAVSLVRGVMETGVKKPAYSMSKAALNMLTLTQADDVKNYDILINAVHPGLVDTDMTKNVPKDIPKLTPEFAAKKIVELATLSSDPFSSRGMFIDEKGNRYY